MRFYGSWCYVGCGNGCNAKFQSIVPSYDGQPLDTNWEDLQNIYNEHNSKCSRESPYTNDPNAFYGNPDECGGFVVEGDLNSGYKYCEY